MNRTVTVRARVDDRDALEAKLYAFTESFGFVVDLEDVYFQSTQGSLKLRTIAPSVRIGRASFYTMENCLLKVCIHSQLTSLTNIILALLDRLGQYVGYVWST